MNGGTQDPLFKSAVLMSPAFQPMFDRTGTLEQGFQNFSSMAGCVGEGQIACLRGKDANTLKQANTAFIASAPQGAFNVGPMPDGKLIRQLPSNEFSTGNYWKELDSLIISHVQNEPELFVDGHLKTDDQLIQFLQTVSTREGLHTHLVDRIRSSRRDMLLPSFPEVNRCTQLRQCQTQTTQRS